jgi:hypothetical protein
MNIFKVSTLALALALTGWVACSSSNNSPDVPYLGTGGTIATGGVTGTGGADGAIGPDAAVSTGGAVADAGNDDAPTSSGPPDAGIDGPAPGTADALGGEVGIAIDICTGLTPQQCHLAIINATPDSTVSALDPGANPPVPYPTCSAQ